MEQIHTLKPRNISGFPDYSEAENYQLSTWLKIVENTFSLFGFSRLIPRPLEQRELLLIKGGIQKQVFGICRLPNDTPTDLALPFDRTVPLAIWVAQHSGQIDFPYKRFDIGYSFRGERAQKGRFQGFYQCDIDIIARDKITLNADAECISVLHTTIERLNIGHAYLAINNIKLAGAIIDAYDIADEKRKAVLQIIDTIPKIGNQAVQSTFIDLVNLSENTAQILSNVFSFSGPLSAFFEETGCLRTEKITEALSEITKLFDILTQLGVPEKSLIFRPCIVRGLDYYSGIVFETFIEGKESFGSISSGGRYDDLVSAFSKSKLPGVGGSIGLTRLFDLALKNNLVAPKRKTAAEIIVCYRLPELIQEAMVITNSIRGLGVNTDIFSAEGNISSQLKYSNNKGIPVAILVMSGSEIIYKNLSTGNQISFTNKEHLISYLKFNHHGNTH